MVDVLHILCRAKAALLSARVVHMKTEVYAANKTCNGLAGEVPLGEMPQLKAVFDQSYKEVRSFVRSFRTTRHRARRRREQEQNIKNRTTRTEQQEQNNILLTELRIARRNDARIAHSPNGTRSAERPPRAARRPVGGSTTTACSPIGLSSRAATQLDEMIAFTAAVEERLCAVLRSGAIPEPDLVDAISVCKIRCIDAALQRVHALRLEVRAWPRARHDLLLPQLSLPSPQSRAAAAAEQRK